MRELNNKTTAIKVRRFFDTKKDANNYKKILKLKDKYHEIHIIKVGEWIFLNASNFDVVPNSKDKNPKFYLSYYKNPSDLNDTIATYINYKLKKPYF